MNRRWIALVLGALVAAALALELRGGREIERTILVTDNYGNPFSDANMEVRRISIIPLQQWHVAYIKTDTNGQAQFRFRESVDYSIFLYKKRCMWLGGNFSAHKEEIASGRPIRINTAAERCAR